MEFSRARILECRELWNYITKDLTFVPSEPLMKMRKILKDVMA